MNAVTDSPAAAIFGALEHAAVRSCLWRGSPRVGRALAGASDFDLLVAAEDAAALASVLRAWDCRRADTRECDPGLEDWFAMAGPGGPLLHFHVHYRLVAGEARLNRFRLPWEDAVLAGRAVLGEGPIHAAAPAAECVLLLLRCSLQLRWRDRWFARPARRIVAKVHSDLQTLRPEGGFAEVAALWRQWLGRELPLPLPPGGAPPRVELADLWRVRRVAVRALRAQASVRGPMVALSVWRRELRAGLRRLLQARGLPVLPARGSACGGLLVVLTGGDAAAEADCAARLRKVFAGKFDVLSLRLDARGLRRAFRGRSRGMLVIGHGTAGGAGRGPVDRADLVLEVDPGRPREQVVAELLAAIWRRF